MKIIECVPNVSEGRDASVIDALAETVRDLDGVELLDVDPGAATHRTVFTFVGSPDAIADAAVAFVARAVELIDMSKHSGAHARQGAVDVVPFVPVGGGATMDDCIEVARQVGERIGPRHDLPVYLYERAASKPERASLADVRKGEYESLEERLSRPDWAPDFGPARFNARSGATAVGARPFLIAYNVNLNTSSKKKAHDIALDIREQGRFARGPDGKILRDAQGERLRKPGKHRALRAVGWYIPEFGRAQVSMNLTDFHVTPPHVAFESVREGARERGMRVTGSELVGLVPLDAMLMAGRHYLESQGERTAVPEPDIVEAARAGLGLDEVKPFDPAEAIIDYRLSARESGLRGRSMVGFADEVSRSTPAPGGGSVSAYAGALGAALAGMVALLGSGSGTEELASLGARAQGLKDRLLRAVDEDSDAFDGIRSARRLSKKTDEQAAARLEAIQRATRHAIDVPLGVAEAAAEVAALALDAARQGLAATASDAGVAALCARTAAHGAALNVRINLPDLEDEKARKELLARAAAATDRADTAAAEAIAAVDEAIASGD